MGKKGKGKRRRQRLQERVAASQLHLAKKREAARQQRVYGGRGDVPPPEQPSISVRAVSAPFESSKRRH